MSGYFETRNARLRHTAHVSPYGAECRQYVCLFSSGTPVGCMGHREAERSLHPCLMEIFLK
jgi:hypothetical protein